MTIAGKKIPGALLIVGALVGLIVLLQIAAWTVFPALIGDAIRSSVGKFSDGLYQADVEQIDLYLFQGALSLEGVSLTYDTARVHASAPLRRSKYYTGTATHIDINLDQLTHLLFGQYLVFDRVEVDQPAVYIHRFPETHTTDSSQSDSTTPKFNAFQLIKPYLDSLRVTSLTVDSASVSLIRHSPSAPRDTISVQGASVTIRNAYVDSVAASRRHGWPRMQAFTIALRDQTFTSIDSLYSYHVDSVGVNPLRGGLSISQLSVQPQWGKYEMGKQRGQLTNWMQLSVPRLEARAIDFPLLTDSLVIHLGSLTVQEADFTLFRDLRLPRGQPQARPLLQERLQSVPFPFQIDTLTVETSTLRYEERRASTEKAGYVSLDSLYLALYGATNRIQDTATVLKADLHLSLMGAGRGNLHLEFPLTSTNGEHCISGQLHAMALDELNPATEPLAFTS